MIEVLKNALSLGSVAALPLMLVGGFLAGVNPCCIALYPAAAAACCGTRGQNTRQVLTGALAFAIGLATATSLIGMAAAVAGRLVTVATPFQYAIAFVPLIMGVHLLGLIKLPFPNLSAGKCRVGGALGAGFLFSLVIGPCSTPFFAAALSYSAYSQNIAYGAVLLFIYGLGASTPIVFAGGSIGRMAQWIDRAGYQIWVNRLTGVMLLGIGAYLIWKV